MFSRSISTVLRRAPSQARTFAAAPFGDLTGKVAVVAGAGNPASEGHGIGAYTSLVLARQGNSEPLTQHDLAVL